MLVVAALVVIGHFPSAPLIVWDTFWFTFQTWGFLFLAGFFFAMCRLDRGVIRERNAAPAPRPSPPGPSPRQSIRESIHFWLCLSKIIWLPSVLGGIAYAVATVSLKYNGILPDKPMSTIMLPALFLALWFPVFSIVFVAIQWLFTAMMEFVGKITSTKKRPNPSPSEAGDCPNDGLK